MIESGDRVRRLDSVKPIAPVLLFFTALITFLVGHLLPRLPLTSSGKASRPRLAAGLLLAVGAVTWFESSFGVRLIAALIAPPVLGLLSVSHEPGERTTSPLRKHLRLTTRPFLVALALLVLAALLIRIPNLGGFGVRLDEMFQYEAAVGFLETGRFVRWDALEGMPGQAYPRAWIHTWLVAQAMRWLGPSLWAGRVVSLAVGLLLFLPVWQLCRLLDLGRAEILLVLFLLTVSPFCITTSRWLRFYGLFMVAFMLMNNGLLGTLKGSRNNLFHGGQLALGGVLSLLVHPVLSAVILPAFGVFLLLEVGCNRDGDGAGLPRPALLAGGLTVLVLLVVTGVAYRHVLFEEFQFTGTLYPIYAVYLTQENLGYVTGGLFVGAALVFFDRSAAERFLLCLLVVPTLLMVFLSGRFPQMRYLGFLIPIALPVLVASGGRLAGALGKERSILLTAAVLLVLVLVPTRSLGQHLRYIWRGNPGFVAFPGMHSPRYDQTLRWLEPGLTDEDKVAVCHSFSPLIARWRRRGIDLHGSPANRKITRGMLRTFERKANRVWILHAANLPHCLSRGAHEAIQHRYRRLKGMPDDLHVRVYVGPRSGPDQP